MTCPSCGKTRDYYARGLCKPCYQRHYKPRPKPAPLDINLDDYRDYITKCRKGKTA